MEEYKDLSGPRLSLPQHFFRRLLHVSQGLVTIYYFFPDTFLYLPKKLILVLLFGGIPLAIESIRLTNKKAIFGQRPHEKRAIGSYAWAMWASLFLILAFPQEIAMPVIIIYAFVDPIIGELRCWKKWSVFPLGWGSALILFLAFGYHPILAGYAALFMVLGEASEVIGTLRIRPELFRLYSKGNNNLENREIKFKTDDNATTQLVPALALIIVYLFLPGVFPGPWFFPLW